MTIVDCAVYEGMRIYGMNVSDMPERHWRFGYPAS